MNLKRKFLSAAVAFACSVNICLTVNAVETVDGYTNVDNYLADSILNGYVSLETGESDEANGLYDPENLQEYTYAAMAEAITADELAVTMPENVTTGQIYEILLADYLTFETEDDSYTDYAEKLFESKKEKFKLSILTDLVDAGVADTPEKVQAMLGSASTANNTKLLQTLKSYDYESEFSGYTKHIADVNKLSKSNASDYYNALVEYLAIAEINQDKVDFLSALETTTDDTDFSSAVANVKKALESSYSDVDSDCTYALKNSWEIIKKNISAVSSAKTAADAVNQLFDSSSAEAAAAYILTQHTISNCVDVALVNICGKYDSSATSYYAEDFHTAYYNNLVYQQNVSDKIAAYAEVMDSDATTIRSLERDEANSSTKITIIGMWYDNYLEYTNTDKTEVDFTEDIVEYNDHYYKVFNNSISWIYAKEYCELMGGHLATVADEDEQAIVEGVARQSPEFDNFWIGGYRTKTSEKWLWVDGTEFSYKNWDDNQPDFHQNEEYYIRFTNKDVNYENWTAHEGKWNDCANEASGDDNTGDAVGIMTFAFICEWDDKESMEQALKGDANGDGRVNVRDCAFIASKIASGQAAVLTSAADYNGDGRINVRDAAALAKALAQ